MHIKLKRAFWSVVALCGGALVVALVMLIQTGSLDRTGLGVLFGLQADVVLSGSIPPAVSESSYLRHANPEDRLEIVISLKLRDEQDLDALIKAQEDPDSNEYQTFIDTAQFAQRYAPEPAAVDRVNRYLRAAGLKVKDVTPNRLLVHAEGTVAQLESAFKVTINQYELLSNVPGGPAVSYFSIDRDPTIPASLGDTVQAVIGLDTFAEMQNRMMMEPKAAARRIVQPPLTPQDVATVYNYPNANNLGASGAPRRKFSGKGVTVAIATAEGYDKKDIDEYFKHHGVVRTGQILDVPVNGVSGIANGETTLDLQLLGSQVPDADIYMYMAVNPKFINFVLTFNRIVTDNKASVMSLSWGLCESDTGWLTMQAENAIFKQAKVQGIAMFVSSGDDGAYDCKQKKAVWAVDFPSSSPHFTAVGGTSLYIMHDSAGVAHRLREEAWSGAGGGISNHWLRPTWQLGSPGDPRVNANIPKGMMRATADVSMNADPYTGYSYLYKGAWSRIGGTSASAPQWAAVWALATEANGGRRLGSANAYVYRLGNGVDYGRYFYDVRVGNNGHGIGSGYPARRGWDHPTGWGAPNAEALARWLVKVSRPH